MKTQFFSKMALYDYAIAIALLLNSRWRYRTELIDGARESKAFSITIQFDLI